MSRASVPQDVLLGLSAALVAPLALWAWGTTLHPVPTWVSGVGLFEAGGVAYVASGVLSGVYAVRRYSWSRFGKAIAVLGCLTFWPLPIVVFFLERAARGRLGGST